MAAAFIIPRPPLNPICHMRPLPRLQPPIMIPLSAAVLLLQQCCCCSSVAVAQLLQWRSSSWQWWSKMPASASIHVRHINTSIYVTHQYQHLRYTQHEYQHLRYTSTSAFAQARSSIVPACVVRKTARAARFQRAAAGVAVEAAALLLLRSPASRARCHPHLPQRQGCSSAVTCRVVLGWLTLASRGLKVTCTFAADTRAPAAPHVQALPVTSAAVLAQGMFRGASSVGAAGEWWRALQQQ